MADVSVRAATPVDAAAVTMLQAAAWRAAYAGSMPAEVLAQVASEGAEADWRAAIETPPSARHRVLVALSGAELVGFTSFGPADDDDLDPVANAEIGALSVHPGHTREGHGSRLVNAAVDHLRGDGFTRAVVWVDRSGDPGGRALRDFLAGAGWEEDGATRTLGLDSDGSVLLEQERLVAAIDEER
jgi:GNAT superfamily N-acetyltransferase